MLTWFIALSHSWLGQYMQQSRWGFAVVEAVHLLGLAVLGGVILIVDLRLLGLILRTESARTISRGLSRMLLISMSVMVLTGIALTSEEALKCYHSPAFRWKMLLLAAALLFYATLHRAALLRTDKYQANLWSRLAGITSLTLWFGVGVAGRAIGLL
ncbi:MAG: DUF6644 family protein [Terriglobus sp.]